MVTYPRRLHSLSPYHRVTLPCWAVAGAMVLLAIAGSGCAGRRYTYKTLPKEYLAAPAQNIQETGLTKLHVPAVNGQLIDLGDVLEVTITTNSSDSSNSTTPLRVEKDGMIHIPSMGRVRVAGLQLDEAEQLIAAEARGRGIFNNPQVLVEMKRQYTNRITVIGPVEDQGIHELTRAESTLLGALVAAGNLTEEAGPEITIRRAVLHNDLPGHLQPPEPRMAAGADVELTAHQQPIVENGVEVINVNLTQAAVGGDGGGQLRDGDVVIVSKRLPRQIYVMGLVRKPDMYELPADRDIRLLAALSMAGERTLQAADKVHVIRQIPGRQEPVVIEISIREAESNGDANLVLAPGDVVYVKETPITMVVKTITDVIRIGIGGNMAFF